MATNYTTGTFTLRLSRTIHEVTGRIYGNYGIHKDGRDYTVTHIPSGLFVYAGIPRQREAIALAVRLDALPVDAGTEAAVRTNLSALLNALREWREEYPRQ